MQQASRDYKAVFLDAVGLCQRRRSEKGRCKDSESDSTTGSAP